MAKAEQILNTLLQQIAKEQNFVNYDLKVEPISSGGANYTSSLHNITITEGNKCVHMFAKVAAVGEVMRTQAPKFFKTESFAYTQLIKIYNKLQEEHQVPKEHRLVFPKFYGCNTKFYEETIVLENLITEGYQAYDRFQCIDWEYAKSAFNELAKLHALAFAYGEYHPEEFSKVLEDLKFIFDTENEMMSGYFVKIIEKALSVINDGNRGMLQRYFESETSRMYLEYMKWNKRPVLGHGDYRPSNLMHRIKKVSLFTFDS